MCISPEKLLIEKVVEPASDERPGDADPWQETRPSERAR
jgi:hypothetical protein